MDATQYVTDRARQMSGAEPAAGMPAYPLYGLGQAETQNGLVWYRKPIVVFPLGVAVGFGLGYLVFAMALPALKGWGKKVKRNAASRNANVPQIEVEEGA